jgi:hypothetical protein
MIDQYVSQLDSPDAERRKQAVIALGKSGDRAALAHLSRVYKTDPNPEIRELALKAGRYLKKETEGQESPSMMDTASDSMYAEPARNESASFLPRDNEEVSEKDIARAKEMVELALDWHVRGQDARALDYLRKALALNPKLRRDAYTSSLAATITGMNGDEAIASLVTGSSSSSSGGGRKEKPKNDGRKSFSDDGAADGVKEVGWSDAMIDLTLYALVWGGGLTIFILAGISVIQLLLNALVATGGSGVSSTSTAQLQEMIDLLPQFRLTLVIGAIIFGIVKAIGVLIQAGVIHFSAVSILGGDGNLTTLIHSIVPTYIAVDILFLVLSIGYFIYAGTTSMNASSAQIRSMGELWNNLQSLYNFAVAVWIGFLIGKVYRYGMFKGCLAEFISYILIAVLFVGFICCSTAALGSLAGSISSR